MRNRMFSRKLAKSEQMSLRVICKDGISQIFSFPCCKEMVWSTLMHYIPIYIWVSTQWISKPLILRKALGGAVQYCFDPAESELTKVNVAGFIFPVHISFLESKLKWIEANCWICRNKTTQVARFLLKLGRHSGSVSFIKTFQVTLLKGAFRGAV